ncbi:MAG: hypothetical protein IPP33_11880 [Flavobacteriales bacterium]|nr:hypothetical protein [Flavobacteriales bacterium]
MRGCSFCRAGGLSHLFIGASYLAEDLRRYDAMRALFLSACERLRWHIAAMESTKGTTAFGGHVRDAQELLKGLGHEAIQENTEWLTNHRDRPIEPVMPG